MFHKITLTACLVIASVGLALAQESWSLERCVTYATQNSLSVKQAQNGVRNAELSLKQGQFNRLPNLNSSISGGYQFGRTIDPTTNEFKTESIGFNSYSISAGALVYGGNQVNNTIKQSRIDLEAAQLDARAAANNVALSVAGSYLSILLAEEQLENANKQREQTQRQLDQTDKLIQAGQLPENDRLDILAQLALNEQNIIDAQNLVNINYLVLKQLMVVDPAVDFRIERPEVAIPSDANPDGFSLESVFSTALTTQPQVKATDLRIQSANLSIQLARANMLPTLTVFGSINSNYSTLGQSITGFSTIRIPQTVYINDVPTTFEFDSQVPLLEKTGFGKQFKDNFGQSLGVSLSIPIYNNHRNSIGMERMRIAALNAELSDKQVRQQLKSDVQRAIADSRSAKLSYEAAQRSVNAAQVAYDNAQKRFTLGAINTLQLTTAGNNLDQAKVNLIRSKYQYLFNIKVVDFYMGRELKL
jgi:outer membrane protein